MLTDLRYAFRQLFKAPAFTIAALLTLSLGIGACTAIYSVVDSVLLRPLDFPESERLVVVSETRLPQYPEFSVAPGQYFSWKEQAKSFENLAASNFESCTMTGTSRAQRLSVEKVTASYFSTLGAHPTLGREFQPEEDVFGHDKVIILMHGFWLRQFGGRTDVLNQTVQLNGEPHTIIGIMPASFRSAGDRDTDILAPAAFDASAHEQRGGHYLIVFGRLKKGVTIEQARSELLLISDQLAKEFPASNKGWSTKINFLLNTMVSSVQPLLLILLGAVGILLLIGCTNVANLLLARAATRGKEIAIRISQGATRPRIIRQLLTESVLLAAIGGGIGAWVAHWGVQALIWLAPGGLPRSGEIVVSNHALGVACGLILLTGVGFGLAPAVQASRVNLNEALKDGGRGTSTGGRRQRLLSALVVTEIAMALALLVGAGLLIRSFLRLQGTNPGFEPGQAVALELNLASLKYATPAQQITFAEQISDALSTLPGVQSVGAAQVLPFSGGSHFHLFNLADRPPTIIADWPAASYYAITPNYFKAMGVPLRSGRFFNEHDSAGSNPVAIINESMAKQFFPDKNPLGAKINITSSDNNWREIVGVVGDAKHFGLAAKVGSQMYEPFLQHPWGNLTFVIRSAGPQPLQIDAARKVITSIDPDQPISSFKRLNDLVAGSLVQQRFSMQLFAVFSGAALALAVIGIYGVMTYSVARRTGEIGIRMALGAQRDDVLKMVFLQGTRLIALGLTVGLAAALILTRFLGSLLYAVDAYDPLTFAVTALLLAIAAALACLLPAYRATQLNPLTALQTE